MLKGLQFDQRCIVSIFIGTLVLCPSVLHSGVLAAEQDDVDNEYDIQEDVQEPFYENKISILNNGNFEETVNKNKNVLVEFYAPWCGHCQALAPEYAKASLALSEKAPEFIIAKVDATVEEELAEKYDVQGFPTMVWFHDGEPKEVEIEGEESAIISWVMKRIGPPADTITSSEDLENFEKQNDVALIGYFEDLNAQSDATLAFEEACREIAFPCANTSMASVASAAGVPKNTVFLVANFENHAKEYIKYTGEMEAAPLQEFAYSHSVPRIVPMHGKYADQLFSTGAPYHLIMFGGKEDVKATSPLMQAFTKVANDYWGKEFVSVVFDVVTSKDIFEDIAEQLGLKDIPVPFVAAFYREEEHVFRMQEKITEENIRAFASGIIDGSVIRLVKSEEIPADGEDYDGNVKIVVKNSFDAVALDPSKDVLVEVYAPWCGRCQSLEPIYHDLADNLKDIPSVVIAKMDGTVNDNDADGFPHLAFYPAKEDSEPIVFDEDTSLMELLKFVHENAAIPFEMPTDIQTTAHDEQGDDGHDDEDNEGDDGSEDDESEDDGSEGDESTETDDDVPDEVSEEEL